MESISIYWMPIWRVLEKSVKLHLVNPYFIKQLPGKIKSCRITHGNKFLRKTTIECSWAASRTKNSFFAGFSYRQCVERRKNKMKVQVAIARKMLVCVWYILHDGVPYVRPEKKSDHSTGS